MLDSMETLFNQFVVVLREDETVSRVLFEDQNEELTLFKADTAFTVEEVFACCLLTFSAKKETFFNQEIVLTREDETVLSEAFVDQ